MRLTPEMEKRARSFVKSSQPGYYVAIELLAEIDALRAELSVWKKAAEEAILDRYAAQAASIEGVENENNS